MVSEPLLKVEDLYVYYKTYKGVLKVLNGVNLELHRGEKIGVIGESGCGKTTTMKAILRILPPNALVPRGKVLFEGKNLYEMKPRELRKIRGRRISMIFQDPTAALNPVFKVGDQLIDVIRHTRHHSSASREELKAEALKLLEEVALPDPERVFNSYPFQLSGGMRQRICIAMAIGTTKDILIADEPTTNLDVTIQDQVLRLIDRLVEKRGISLILISQALGIIRSMVSRVYTMYAGEVVEVAETYDTFSKPLHPYTRGLVSSVPRLTGEGIPEGISGRIPDYLNPPKGCRFSPRCEYAEERCHKERPPLIDVGGRKVACWLYA